MPAEIKKFGIKKNGSSSISVITKRIHEQRDHVKLLEHFDKLIFSFYGNIPYNVEVDLKLTLTYKKVIANNKKI